MPGSTPPKASRTASRIPTAEVIRAPRAAIIPRKGLQLSPRVSFDQWLDIGHQLCSLTTSAAWCLGDWLVYGETAFTGRYREAIEQTSLDYQTLRNYAWVAKRFALSRRRDSLSFGHHAEVTALTEPEQEFWLRKAEELSWSRNQLRRELRGSLRERVSTGTPRRAILRGRRTAGSGLDHGQELTLAEVTLEVRISARQLDICQVAAISCGLNLDDWVLRTLEEGAHATLTTTVAG